jgi:hypothetical protein
MDMQALLNVSTSAPLSTVVKSCREGDFKATIDDGDKWLSFKEIKTAAGTSYQLVILFNILDDGVRKELGRDKVLVPKNIWLDQTESGTLDTGDGKNVDLGRLLAAAGLNAPGNQMEKVNQLRGKGPFIVKVTQRADPKDPSIKYAEVRRVSKLS